MTIPTFGIVTQHFPIWAKKHHFFEVFSTIIVYSAIFYLITSYYHENNISMKKEFFDKKTFANSWKIGTFFTLFFFLFCFFAHFYLDSFTFSDLLRLKKFSPYYIFYDLSTSCIFAPLLEEFLFRGILFNVLKHKFNVYLGAILSSLIFASAHLNFNMHFVNLFVFGLIACWIYHKNKQLIFSVFLHSIHNYYILLYLYSK